MAEPNQKPEDKPKTARDISFDKIKTIALSFSPSAPDEHVVFGGGGHKFTLGDLRDLTNTRR